VIILRSTISLPLFSRRGGGESTSRFAINLVSEEAVQIAWRPHVGCARAAKTLASLCVSGGLELPGHGGVSGPKAMVAYAGTSRWMLAFT